MKSTLQNTTSFIIAGIGVLVVAGASYLLYQQHLQSQKIESLVHERDALKELTASSSDALAQASSTIASLTSELAALKEEYGILNDDYTSELGRNENFQSQIKKISKTVGTLDKLSKTDKELLQKYSKVYFLNEHYIPEQLSTLDNKYVYDESRTQQLHSKVLPSFTKMVDAAKEDGVDLFVVSAYRSFQTQAQLKGTYTVKYGTGANAFSADQGYSEHQLGTTIDFTTKGINGGLSGFQNTPAYTWLKDNAYKYGFTLSYPEKNSYYTFEPWHWRFVGADLASDLHSAKANFYDWDQRKIDGYLINIFD
jgi:LAS superfamily LD-carboxypeptidase LdcB